MFSYGNNVCVHIKQNNKKKNRIKPLMFYYQICISSSSLESAVWLSVKHGLHTLKSPVLKKIEILDLELSPVAADPGLL